MHHRCPPASLGPSSKTWPRCEWQRAQRTSVRTISCELSSTSSTASGETVSVKLGQPVPEWYFARLSKSGLPQARRTVGLGVGCSRLDQHVIDVAIAPVFSRLEGPDNRVPRVVEVCGCVLVLRFIAATYVPARQAFPEMYPLVPGPEAFLAALGGGNYAFSYLISVCTPLSPEHLYLPPPDPIGSCPRLPRSSLSTRRGGARPGTTGGCVFEAVRSDRNSPRARRSGTPSDAPRHRPSSDNLRSPAPMAPHP